MEAFRPNPALKLMDQVREVMRYHHYAFSTEKNYCHWIRQYIHFHGTIRHPAKMGKAEIEAFLSHLAVKRKVSVSTQKQALNAIAFLYKRVLLMPINEHLDMVRARRPVHIPVVLTVPEVEAVLDRIHGTHRLMARLLYGSGLRLMECVRLRIKDVDLKRGYLHIREAKGGKERVTVLPSSLVGDLSRHIARVATLHTDDLAEGFGRVHIPDALARKFPAASSGLGWQFVFPAKNRSRDPVTGLVRRHHVLESGLQKAMRRAVKATGITKSASCHTLRHSFATHLLENGVNIRTVQKLMGHKDVKTTEIYTHVMQQNIDAVISPLDGILKPSSPSLPHL